MTNVTPQPQCSSNAAKRPSNVPIALDLSAHIRCVMGNELNSPLPALVAQGTVSIGVFDSGMGGLSVLKHLQQALPQHQFVYLADTKHVPYGERSHVEIEQLTHAAVAWLYQQGCDLVVVACNSASTHSLPSLREKYGKQLPIVGLVPALKPAVLHTKTKKVAVLATNATLKGYLLNQVIEDVALPAGVGVLKFAEPALVPWVEAGMPENHVAFGKLQGIIDTVQQQGADHLVLGCTHFPFFADKIHTLAPQLTLVDSGEAIARRVVELLRNVTKSYCAPDKKSASIEHSQSTEVLIFTTGDTLDDIKKIKRLIT